MKTRGTWGEVQLESLLHQILAPEQFAKNVATKKGSEDRVEFAIRLPGREHSTAGRFGYPSTPNFPWRTTNG